MEKERTSQLNSQKQTLEQHHPRHKITGLFEGADRTRQINSTWNSLRGVESKQQKIQKGPNPQKEHLKKKLIIWS